MHACGLSVLKLMLRHFANGSYAIIIRIESRISNYLRAMYIVELNQFIYCKNIYIYISSVKLNNFLVEIKIIAN